MKFADHLNKEQIQKFNQLRHTPKKNQKEPKPKRKQEKLSERDWAEIMGTGRDTYKRVGGAVRRK